MSAATFKPGQRVQFAKPLPVQSNGVKIGRQLLRCSTLADAVKIWCDFRDSTGFGASECPGATACIDGKLYRISYNGRVWDAGTGAEVVP